MTLITTTRLTEIVAYPPAAEWIEYKNNIGLCSKLMIDRERKRD